MTTPQQPIAVGASAKAYQNQIDKFILEQAGLTAAFDVTLPIFQQAYIMKTINPSSPQYTAEYDAAKAALDKILQDSKTLAGTIQQSKSALDTIITKLDDDNNNLKKQVDYVSKQLSIVTSSDNAMIPRYSDYTLSVNGNYAKLAIQVILIIAIVAGLYRLSGTGSTPSKPIGDITSIPSVGRNSILGNSFSEE